MISSIISRLVILVFGTLYPAYASYKAVRTKNLKEYVKWMMYWIVFALFTCTETFTDVFLSWFPFYYEVKIVIVLWLLSPATKGSSILYRKFVHPALCRREQEIDEYIAKAKDQGYHTVLNLGTKGVNYATTVIMQTAIKGGGGLVQQLRKSYSLSDLSECEPREERAPDEADDVLAEPRLIRRAIKSGFATRRSASESNSRTPIYFPEVDVDVRGPRRVDEPDFSHIKSSEDISSGYSSAENSSCLSRTSSAGARSRRVTRTTITSIKRPQAAEDNEVIEELPYDDICDNSNNHRISSPLYLSHTNPPFIYQYAGDQVNIIQVLGNYPLSNEFDKKINNLDSRDQKETVHKTSQKLDAQFKSDNENVIKDLNVTNIPVQEEIKDNKNNMISQNNESVNIVNTENVNAENDFIENTGEFKTMDEITDLNDEGEPEIKIHNTLESDESSFETPTSVESDEGSFGTPASTPKTVRKMSKGKYGKDKAPMPPSNKVLDDKQEIQEDSENLSIRTEVIESIETKEKKSDDVVVMPIIEDIEKATTDFNLNESEIAIDAGDLKLEINNTSNSSLYLDDKHDKKSHKSKSPGPKAMSTLGKMLQLPNKLVFWHKATGNVSDASDSSRKSSIESLKDESRGCSYINTVHKSDYENDKNKSDEKLSTDNISQEISEKSDELQKVIEAKLESNPEYKFIPLCEDIQISKSTDV
ncbi:uncharacterized protein LOC116769826 isoform X1 [Danaus plexippus]|uniref:uncharacterized protein LOC116769826 isoform X1 n=1 Tax=Danaus plexippus TaxID=13037 RepID=UPI002AB19BFF|nr:uncharacterized protein LOC116769826 isoform X1 [Danaus plexippus]